MERNKAFLESKECRRSTKVFKVMACTVRTRGPDQCRSHHQKMQKKYDSIDNIIFNCRKSLPKLKKRQMESVDKVMPECFEPIEPRDLIVAVEEPRSCSVEVTFNDSPFELKNEKEPSEIGFFLQDDNNSLFGLYQDDYDMII